MDKATREAIKRLRKLARKLKRGELHVNFVEWEPKRKLSRYSEVRQVRLVVEAGDDDEGEEIPY